VGVSIKIFEVNVPVVGLFSAWCVDGEQPFLICTESTNRHPPVQWQCSLDDARMIGAAAAAVIRRFEWADKTGSAPTGGTLYEKVSPDGETVLALAIEELQYSDPALLFTFAGAGVRLPGDQGTELLRALLRLGAQALLVRQASPFAGGGLGLAAAGPSRSSDILAALHARLNKRIGW